VKISKKYSFKKILDEVQRLWLFNPAEITKMIKREKAVSIRKEVETQEDLEKFKEEIIHEIHVISEGLIDQIKLLAEGHTGIIGRINMMDAKLDRMEKENERQHLETRALVKISFSELDRRVSELESQVKDLQDWKKQVQTRLQS
jgi:hypothetical protein